MSPLLLVVEGANDYEFLVRLAARIRKELPTVPDLQQLSAAGRIVILPAGGGDPSVWAERLAPLGLPQFHLYDREQEPHIADRRRAIEHVNGRPGCRARLLSKRSLENYLHPQAIHAAGGGHVAFGDDDAVAWLVAQTRYCTAATGITWELLPERAQRRCAQAAKRWLNRVAVDQMTASLLAERDPHGEIVDCLVAIGALCGSPAPGN